MQVYTINTAVLGLAVQEHTSIRTARSMIMQSFNKFVQSNALIYEI